MADPKDFRRGGGSNDTYNPDGGAGGGLRPAAMATQMPFVPPTRTTMTSDAVAALASIEPALTSFLDKRANEQAATDVEAGRQKALELAMEDGEAIKAGKLNPNESKWFMKGYKAQYGENLGQQWALEAKVAWEQSEAKNSDKPEAVSQFLSDFTATKLKDPASRDPDIRAGILPHLARTRASLTAAQAEYSANKVKETHLENVGVAISNDIDLYRAGKMTREGLLNSIQQRDAAGRLIGVSNDDMNKSVVLAVTNKARERNDLSLLNILKEYPHVGNNPKYATAVRSAEDGIIGRSNQLESLAWTREQRARQERERVGLVSVYDAVLDQVRKGEEPKLTPQIEAMVKATGAPDAYTKAVSFAKTMKEQSAEMSVAEINRLNQDIINAGPYALARLDYEVSAGTIKNKEVYGQLSSTAKIARDVTNDRTFVDYTNRIIQYGGKDALGKSIIDPFAAEQTANEFRRRFIEFVQTNPQTDPQKRDEFARNISEALMKELDKHKLGTGASKYNGEVGKLRGMSDDALMQLYRAHPPKQ